MNSKTTLKKISESLNLSISTVSRALKNHPDISAETKKKVRELADLLDYEPNTYAINLRTNSSRVFGLIVPTISNFFYESFIAAAEKKSRENGYLLMVLQSSDDPAIEADSLKLCRLNRVAGVFISLVPGSSTQPFTSLEEANVPVVYFDKVPDSESVNTVCLADEEASAMAAGHILSYGKKKILAVFGNEALSITQRRLKGFRDGLKGVTDIQIEIRHCSNSEEAREVCKEIISTRSGIDQVFAMSDEILIGVMKALNESAISIPSQVSVLAISNGFLPNLYKPRISFVETNGYALGELAVQRMLDYFSGQKFSRKLILPSVLVENESMRRS